jgi:hypothetical protein
MCVQQIVTFYSYNSLRCCEIISCDNVCLKVLSSEMDPAEIWLILKVFINGEVRRLSANFAGSVALRAHLKVLERLLVF